MANVVSNTSSKKRAIPVDLTELTQRTAETVRNAGKFEVEVTSGAHRGAKLSLDPGAITVGSGKNNTIVLFADTLAEHHVEIELPAKVFKDIRVSPLEKAITLEDGSVVEIGQYAEISSGETVTLGDAELAITRIADPASFVKPGLRVLAFVCLLAMVPLIYGLVSGMAVGVADASSKAFSVIQTGINTQKDKYLGASMTTEKGQLEAFSWTARTKLEDLKLNHRLRVSPTNTGSLRVYGNISDQELDRWTGFLQWYDSNPAFPPLIRDVNRSDVDRDLPQINSVWMDDQPTVVFSDGTIASVGSQLKDGWKLVSISDQNVTLERDGAYVSLTY